MKQTLLSKVCLIIVHQRIGKYMSIATVIEMYNTDNQGIQDDYEMMKEGVKELDGKKLTIPPQCVLKKQHSHLRKSNP